MSNNYMSLVFNMHDESLAFVKVATNSSGQFEFCICIITRHPGLQVRFQAEY